MLIMGMLAMIVLIVLTSGCIKSGEKKEEPAIIGLEKLNTNDDLNIVNWTVQGIHGKPKLNLVDWELINEPGNVVWNGMAVKYTGIPDSVGVYYIDINQNDKIDVGDTFCVKALENGHFTLQWFIDGNTGKYESDY